MTIHADFASRPWNMLQVNLERFLAGLAAIDLVPYRAARRQQAEDIRAASERGVQTTLTAPPPFAVVGTDAVIDVRGLLLNSVPEWMAYYGIEATGYDTITAAVAAADADPRITRIVLAFDTPGGQAGGGVQSAADAIFAATKPTLATCQDLCASAGVYLAAQADRFVAAPGATVGSIGTYLVAYDASRMADRAGITVDVISSGPEKGGAYGAPVSDAKRAGYQKTINDLTALFVDAVSRGRGMHADDTRSLATGAVWLAAEAASNGLIDAVQTHAQALATAPFAARPTQPSTSRAIRRASTAGVTPATRQESIMDAKKLAALCSAHPTHTTLILAMNGDDKSEADILAAIAGADVVATKAKVGELEGKLAAQGTAHAAALAAKDSELATAKAALVTAQAKAGKVDALIGAKDPGADQSDVARKATFTRAQVSAGKVPEALRLSGDYLISDS